MTSILNEPVEIRLARAKNPETDQETLSILSDDHFWFVRDFVASNPNTPHAILLKLLEDPDFRVRNEADRNLKKKNLDQQIAYASYQERKHSPKKPHPFDPLNHTLHPSKEQNYNQER